MIAVYIRVIDIDNYGSRYGDDEIAKAFYGRMGQYYEYEITRNNNCIMVSRSIDSPAMKTNFVSLGEAYDGVIDKSDYNGIRYDTKTVTVKLRCVKDYDVDTFKRLYLGHLVGIRFGDEAKNIYHVGRLTNIDDDYNEAFRTFELTIQGQPYRLEMPNNDGAEASPNNKPSSNIELSLHTLADLNLLDSNTGIEAITLETGNPTYIYNGSIELSTSSATIKRPIARAEFQVSDAETPGELYLHYVSKDGYCKIIEETTDTSDNSIYYHEIPVRNDGGFDIQYPSDNRRKYYLYFYGKKQKAVFTHTAIFRGSLGTIVDGGDKALTPFQIRVTGEQPNAQTAIHFMVNGSIDSVNIGGLSIYDAKAVTYNKSIGLYYDNPFLILHQHSNKVFLFTLEESGIDTETKFFASYSRQVI